MWLHAQLVAIIGLSSDKIRLTKSRIRLTDKSGPQDSRWNLPISLETSTMEALA